MDQMGLTVYLVSIHYDMFCITRYLQSWTHPLRFFSVTDSSIVQYFTVTGLFLVHWLYQPESVSSIMAETQNVSQEDMPIGHSSTLRAHFSRQAPVHLTLDPTEAKARISLFLANSASKDRDRANSLRTCGSSGTLSNHDKATNNATYVGDNESREPGLA